MGTVCHGRGRLTVLSAATELLIIFDIIPWYLALITAVSRGRLTLSTRPPLPSFLPCLNVQLPPVSVLLYLTYYLVHVQALLYSSRGTKTGVYPSNVYLMSAKGGGGALRNARQPRTFGVHTYTILVSTREAECYCALCDIM